VKREPERYFSEIACQWKVDPVDQRKGPNPLEQLAQLEPLLADEAQARIHGLRIIEHTSVPRDLL
jgi:hypothetical protein